MALGGLGVAAVAAGFIWALGPVEEVEEAPEDAIVLVDYDFRDDGEQYNMMSLLRFIIFNGQAYVRLRNGGWLHIIAMLGVEKYCGAIMLEARGGQKYTFDIRDSKVRMESVSCGSFYCGCKSQEFPQIM